MRLQASQDREGQEIEKEVQNLYGVVVTRETVTEETWLEAFVTYIVSNEVPQPYPITEKAT